MFWIICIQRNTMKTWAKIRSSHFWWWNEYTMFIYQRYEQIKKCSSNLVVDWQGKLYEKYKKRCCQLFFLAKIKRSKQNCLFYQKRICISDKQIQFLNENAKKNSLVIDLIFLLKKDISIEKYERILSNNSVCKKNIVNDTNTF